MMKKVWPVLLAVVLVFGLVVSCGGNTTELKPGKAFSFEGPWDGVIKGDAEKVTIDGNQITIVKGGSDSAGGSNTTFSMDFADIGYTYSEGDILVFTYEIVSIAADGKAVLSVKNPANWGGNFNGVGGADWGIGKGCEYVLGDETLSVYDGPLVEGTYNTATKVGTYEVLMRLLKGATGIGFQHNAWASFGPASTYSFKLLKIENKVAEEWTCDCGGDKTKCQCGADCDCPECEMPAVDTTFFDNATALKTGIAAQNKGTFDATTGIIDLTDVSGSALFTLNIPATTAAGSKKIKITYACILTAGEPKITWKTPSWGDPPNKSILEDQNAIYVTLIYNAVGTIEMPEGIYDNATTQIAFQRNGDTNAFKLKIISATVE